MIPDQPGRGDRSILFDAALAILLATLLTVAWTITDWSRLGRMLLPDPDDMMRLAQVRDLIAGQGLNDWTQYRLAPPHGAPMHWSRLNDIGIAAIIVALTPIVGQAMAELAAVLLYPALLFAAAIWLSARIARRLWGATAAPVAAVLTALAYPGTTVFVPGRIDHHALQVVLVQLSILALMRTPSVCAGAILGALTAVSLVVGLETVPQVAMLVTAMSLFWLVDGSVERPRMAGFAAALGGVTLIFLAFLRPTLWSGAYCDAFTPASSSGTLAVAAAFGLLAALTPRLIDWRRRLAVGGMFGGVALGGTLIAFPACLAGPYGTMDPFLIRAFLPYIDEANSVFHQPPGRIVSIGGLLIFASLVALAVIVRERRKWRHILPLAGVVVISGAVMLAQVRGVYIGATVAAPLLAGFVVAARARETARLPALLAAWLLSAGMTYHAASGWIDRAFAPPAGAMPDSGDPAGAAKPQVACAAGDSWAQIDALPPGVVMTGTNISAYVIGATHHSTVAATYHRNDAGNMAMYRFFLGAPPAARAIAGRWRVDYVLFCPGDFDELDVARDYPASLAAGLRGGRSPDWLQPIPLKNTPLRVYRVRLQDRARHD